MDRAVVVVSERTAVSEDEEELATGKVVLSLRRLALLVLGVVMIRPTRQPMDHRAT